MAGVLPAAVVAGQGASFAEQDDAVTAAAAQIGTVTAVSENELSIHDRGTHLRVIPSTGARMYSGASGEVYAPNQFVVSDRVVVEGEVVGDVMRATSIGSLFVPIHLEITAVSSDGSTAETSLGPIELTGGRLPFMPESSQPALRIGTVRPGDVISGLVWRHPSTGETFLLVRAEA